MAHRTQKTTLLFLVYYKDTPQNSQREEMHRESYGAAEQILHPLQVWKFTVPHCLNAFLEVKEVGFVKSLAVIDLLNLYFSGGEIESSEVRELG